MLGTKEITIGDIVFTCKILSVRQMMAVLALQKQVQQLDASDAQSMVAAMTSIVEHTVTGWSKPEPFSADAVLDHVTLDQFIDLANQSATASQVTPEKKLS